MKSQVEFRSAYVPIPPGRRFVWQSTMEEILLEVVKGENHGRNADLCNSADQCVDFDW